MNKQEAMGLLRSAFAYLYSDPESIKIIASDAGMDSTKIKLQGSADQIWFNVLEEAERRSKIDVLVQLARKEYPNKALQNAYNAYLQASDTDSTDSSQMPLPPDKPTMIVNTGGGTYIAGDVNVGGDFIGRDQTK